jgi:hypothetical protein
LPCCVLDHREHRKSPYLIGIRNAFCSLSWATSNPFSKKSCAAQEAVHDHFRFFASLRGSFFRAPGERFIEWRQRRDKFSWQYPRQHSENHAGPLLI